VTIDQEFFAPGDDERPQRVLQIIENRGLDVKKLRVLDLACRTGVFARTVAEAGGGSVGIEGKPGNFAMIPETPGAQFFLDDVRNLSKEKYGTFDVSLCLGILYHLDADDALRLLIALREVTTGFVIIDTHIGGPATTISIDGIQYQGWYFQEPGTSDQTLWSSMGNTRSFWFTPESLHRLIVDAGFTTVEEQASLWTKTAAPAARYCVVAA
jgi:hypothetical protein